MNGNKRVKVAPEEFQAAEYFYNPHRAMISMDYNILRYVVYEFVLFI